VESVDISCTEPSLPVAEIAKEDGRTEGGEDLKRITVGIASIAFYGFGVGMGLN
jgi:hypothetical protein